MNFRDELVQEAHQLPVSNTDIDAIITTARVRNRRRRVATSTLAAGFVIAGSAFGIQQLSAVRNNAGQASAPAPTVPAEGGSTTVPIAGMSEFGDSGELVIDSAIPAQVAAPNITWSIVEGNSPEALASLFDPAQRYVLATMPSASPEEVPQQQLFEHGADGSWNAINFNKVQFLEPIVSGDTIYGIGTAPATAGAAPGAFGTYDPASGSWQLQELPEQIRPYESDKVESLFYLSTVPVDGGLLAIVDSGGAILKYDAFPEFMNDPMAPVFKDGAVHRYASCDGTALDNAMNFDDAMNGDGGPSSDAEYEQIFTDNCQEEVIDPAQLGLSPDDVAALQRSSTPSTSTVWKITGDAMVPAEIPGVSLDGAEGLHLEGNTLVLYRGTSDTSAEMYAIGSDGSATRVFADVPPQAANLIMPGASDGNRALATGGQYLFTAMPGAPTQFTDLKPAVTTGDMVNPTVWIGKSGFAGPLVVATADVNYSSSGTVTEPTTISDSGYSLVIGGDLDYQVIDEATGQEPEYGYELSTESGKVDLLLYPEMPMETAVTVPEMTDGDYAMMTEGDYPQPEKVASFDIPWTAVPGLNSQVKSMVLTSADGVNFAVTDLNEVLGTDVSVVDTETTSDGRVIISAWRNDTGADVFLVGTPN